MIELTEYELSIERWLPVVGYEGRYDVSDMGRVRSVTRTGVRCNGWRNVKPGIVRSQREFKKTSREPYMRVTLYKDGANYACLVHHLVLDAFVGPRKPGQECCHGPGGQSDNRLTNLRWGTRKANIEDLVASGHYRAAWTHCSRQHLLRAPNLVPSSVRAGKRRCLACQRAQSFSNNRRRRGHPIPDFQVLSDKYYAAIMAGQKVSA